MRVLLDTHVFLWWITDDLRLSGRAREVISDGRNELFFSAASGWEIAIKAGLGSWRSPETCNGSWPTSSPGTRYRRYLYI